MRPPIREDGDEGEGKIGDFKVKGTGGEEENDAGYC